MITGDAPVFNKLITTSVLLPSVVIVGGVKRGGIA